jgi:UDP-N-acetylmuramyl pentapeptide phosphotransferase/UDP-N-acetylglucosamine-1-phosphate transferase
MNLTITIIFLISTYLIMSLIAHRFQTLTSSISKDLNGGNLNTDYQTMMTPTFMGLIVILNFIWLTILFIILFVYFNWYTALLVLLLPFIVPFLEYFIPILPKKTMFKIIKNELYKNISSNPIKLLIINYIERVFEQKM